MTASDLIVRRTGGYRAALFNQIASEVTRYRRVPEYVVGVVMLPVILFAMFGLTAADEPLPSGLTAAGVFAVSFAAYGVVSQSLFSFGSDLAEERSQGWLRRMRATPMPMSVYFGGKLAMNLIFALVMVVLLFGVALLCGDARFEWPRAAAAAAMCVSGALWFAPTGAAIAYWARPKAATTIVNLVFLPLAFLSGFFNPVKMLPDLLQDLAHYMPTYHFGALAWRTLTSPEDLEYFMDDPNIDVRVSAAVLVGWFAITCLITVAGYRREQSRQRS